MNARDMRGQVRGELRFHQGERDRLDPAVLALARQLAPHTRDAGPISIGSVPGVHAVWFHTAPGEGREPR